MSKQRTKTNESGQTLIETIVAIFILTSGLTAGVTLALFAFGENAQIRDRLIGTGLAREGAEVIRGMRDTNWVVEAAKPNNLRNCSFYGPQEVCYEDWLNSEYDVRGNTAGADHRVRFDPDSLNKNWIIDNEPGNRPQNFYRIYEGSVAGYTHDTGAATNFFRKITLTYETGNNNHRRQPRILVRSVVWWHGKRCNNNLYEYNNLSDTNCRVVIEEYLTNWRNY